MGGTAVEELEQQVLAKRSPLVLGLDPRPERMPPAFRTGAGITDFHARLIELLADRVVAIKPQIAFFEALGVDGLYRWVETCERARAHGLVVIGDVKRGDIGSTAEAYARAHFKWADMLTVNPYLGDDAMAPFLERCRDEGKGLFVLCATSNPGWTRFQAVPDAEGRPLYLRVADAIAEWNASLGGPRWGPVGAVVGATHPEVLAAVRAVLDRSWLLLPGVGAQGAQVAELRDAFADDGTGVLLPVSRGLASCFDPEDQDWEAKVDASASGLLSDVRAAVPALQPV